MAAINPTVVASANSREASVVLIPWDANSSEHVERMRLQRIACGWKEEEVEGWKQLQNDGKMGIHWIVLASSSPQRDARIARHVTRFPEEASSLKDTFGHISLDAWSPKALLGVSGSDGVYSISTFYVSEVLQSSGLGGAAMDICEQNAKNIFDGKAITLDTIAKEEIVAGHPRMVALGREVPKVGAQEWYERRGYVVYTKQDGTYIDTDSTGKVWLATAVFMKKSLE